MKGSVVMVNSPSKIMEDISSSPSLEANSESLSNYADCLQNVFHQKNTTLLNNLNMTLITPESHLDGKAYKF